MKRIHTILIGAGQAGLALSRCLTDRGIEHVLFERGRVAQRWSERWDSLRLLTPNWMTRLPGFRYQGNDPNGFMNRDEIIALLRRYATSFSAPVQEETNVTYAAPWSNGWGVMTDRGSWFAQNVVIATGHCQSARVPEIASGLSHTVDQLTLNDYRSPGQLRRGGVMVVGASASGVQLARELRLAGREVTLAVGRHTRLPRRYRGRDILYWLDRTGLLHRSLSDMRDAEAAKREPSLQLIGGDREESVGLNELSSLGVHLTGRLAQLDGKRAWFERDLAANACAADERLGRLLQRIDRHIAAHGLDRALPPASPFQASTRDEGQREIDLPGSGIRTILWAGGYKRSYPWLHAPVLDERGEIRNDRGRTPMPGLYVLGLQFMIRRNSSFIDGVGRDAEEIAERIAGRNEALSREAA